jgi:hypothetical protein
MNGADDLTTTTTAAAAAAAMSLHPLESAGAAGVQEMPRQQQQTQRVKQTNAVMNNDDCVTRSACTPTDAACKIKCAAPDRSTNRQSDTKPMTYY